MAEYLYVHVPFCRSICGYCDFQRSGYSEGLADKWLDALQQEIEHRCLSEACRTIYLGGGTPSCLNIPQLRRLLTLLEPYSHHVIEYTMEMNPESCSDEIVSLAASFGINRVSLGVQSFDDGLLKMMNRRHTSEMIKQSIETLHRHGIHNISVDAMYSLPNQTMEQWMSTLETCVSLPVTHLSMYSLTIEPGSAFAKQKLEPLDAETEADMYEAAVAYLELQGFEQYEISSFARPGFQSLHNKAYWHYEDFAGIGLGASGKEHHQRYDHVKGFQNYLKNPLQLELIPLTLEDEMFEMLMMGLRLKEGMSLSLFEKRYNQRFEEVYAKPLAICLSRQWVVVEQDKIKATKRGFEILNTVLEEFI